MNSAIELDYYNQLHTTLRMYQKELWGIPVLLFGLEGFIFLKIINDSLPSPWKYSILLANLLALVMIHIYFEKIRDRSAALQRKIKKFDVYFTDSSKAIPKRISLYKGNYKLSSIISSSKPVSATTWFRVSTLFFTVLSIILLI